MLRICGRSLVSLNVCRSDNLRPFFGLDSDEGSEVSRRRRHRDDAEVSEPRGDLRVRKRSVDLTIEGLDDVTWRTFWRADPIPAASLVAGQKLRDSRHIRQRVLPARGRDGKSAQLPAPDMSDQL